LNAPATPLARPRWIRWAGGAAVVLAGIGLLGSLPFTERGTRWLLQGAQVLVPSLGVEAPAGPLLGSFGAERLTWRLANGQRLVIEQARWTAPRFEHHRFWGLHLASLTAARVALVGTAAPSTSPTTLPTELRLPVGLAIDQVQVDRLDLPPLGDQPVRDIRFTLLLPPGEQVRHEVRRLSLRWERLQAQGSASIGADAPMLLKAQLQLRNDAAPGAAATAPPAVLNEDWQANLQALGSLNRFKVQGRLRARGQSVDAEALLRPGQALPIESAEARMEGFDLAGLSRQWPRTALAGLVQVQLGKQGSTTPLQIKAELRNTAAGAWEDQALPLRALQLEGSTSLDNWRQGELQQWLLEFGSAQRSGGRLQGQGLWRTEGSGAQRALNLRLQTRLQGLRPNELDPRAPAIELSGPARLEWQQPWPAEGAPADTPTLGTGRLQAEWTGRHLGPLLGGQNPAVRLQLDLEGNPTLLTLRHFEASAGASSWTASGTARREAAAWALQLESTLQAFDPALWLGTLTALPPSRIDAKLDGRLQWRDATGRASDWQQRLRGDARLQLQPSVLGGVPGQGELTLRSTEGLQADGRFALGARSDNPSLDAAQASVALSLQGRLDPRSGANASDHWQLRWNARRLEVLSPWLATLPGRPTLGGQAQGELFLDGRWPALTSHGQWQSEELRWRQGSSTPDKPVASAAQDVTRAAQQVIGAAQRAVGAPAATLPSTAATPSVAPSTAATPAGRPGVTLHGLQARWQLGSRPDDRFDVDVRVTQTQAPAFHLLASTLHSEGTMGRHVLRLQSTLVPQQQRTQVSAQPDGSAIASSTLQGGAPWALQAAAEGGWALGETSNTASDRTLRRAAGGAPWGWRGQLTQLQGRRTVATTAQAALDLRLEPAALSVLRDDLGLRMQLSATRLRLNDTALTLETLRYESNGAGPSLDLQAQLPPTPAAPLLALAQPSFGWRGDLQITGRIDVQGRPNAMTALIELNRHSGDLAVADLELGTGAQTLGLSDASVKLQAQNGRWSFTERIAGSRMGRLSGDFAATAAPADWVPGADAPLRGQVDLDVAQLGFWGAWLPAGWRLNGQLTAQARASGRIGAPRLDGDIRGQRIAVRNVLEGIDWRESELQARLAGDALLLDRLVLHAGTGTLTASGRATLVASPTITLQATAERFAVLQRVDRRVVMSGTADLLVDATRLRLNGRLSADAGRIDFSQSGAPSLSSDVDVRRASDGESQLATQGAPQRVLQLDVRADLGNHFQLTGRGLNTRLAGELRLSAANNRPLLQGTIRAEDGTYASYGQKLGIERGLVVFTGPIENPRLDVLATRTDISDVKVGVAITGSAQNPRVRLYSDPDMSDTDKLSWLLMGRASDGLGRSDLALLQRAAYALLAGESDGPSLVQRIGLDNLSVSQSDSGTTQQTVVSLGKQLSRRWYLGYERSLQATTGTWLVTYKIAQRFTVRMQGGYQNALDLIWSWRWGLNE
jgi:translocation and assembly module TamB